MNRIAVIGAGGWGTALAKLLAEQGHEVTLWCHGADSFAALNDKRENLLYLAGIAVPPALRLTRSLGAAVKLNEIILCAVPSHAVREVFSAAAADFGAHQQLVCATKGLEEGSLKTMAELFGELLGATSKSRMAFLSGPTFAREVALGLPAAVTVASHNEALAVELQAILSTANFRVYTSTDVVGVQIGGVVKNVIAIAAGISDGLGLGQNARAALITRGLAEMGRLASRMGADPLTLAGLPGLGDLVLTCTGDLSRNRAVGLEIAKGRNLHEILSANRTVAEGVRNTRALWQLAGRLQVEMPIVEQMYKVLYQQKPPATAVRDLMQRSLKSEQG